LDKGVGKKGERFKTFHSFRHTFQRQFYEKGIPSYIVKALVGHSQADEGEGMKSYADGPDLETLNKALHECVSYDLDFTVIKSNGWLKTRLSKRRAKR
jgi:integrase